MVGVAAIPAADGQEPVDDADVAEDAEAHYRMAIQLFGEGRYRESVQEFDRVLELHEDPVVHCNRAIPLIELGRLAEAHTSLAACRDGYPEGSQDRGEVAAELEALEVTLDAIRPATMEVIDDVIAAEAVETRPEDDGDDEDESDVAEPEEVVEPPAPAVEEPAVSDDETGLSWARITALVAGGVGLGMGGAAAVVDWQSADLVEEYRQESQGTSGTSAARHTELRDRIETRQRLFWGLAGGGAAAIVTGIGLWSWDALRTPDRRTSLSIGFDDAGPKAVWRLQF